MPVLSQEKIDELLAMISSSNDDAAPLDLVNGQPLKLYELTGNGGVEPYKINQGTVMYLHTGYYVFAGSPEDAKKYFRERV